MIKEQTDTWKWEFVFLGANQDAIATATKLSIDANKSMTYAANHRGVTASYDSLSKNFTAMRCSAPGNATMDFDASDRQAQADAGVK
jgi:hypothetical protein